MYDAFPYRYELFRDELDPKPSATSTTRKGSTKNRDNRYAVKKENLNSLNVPTTTTKEDKTKLTLKQCLRE